MKPKLDLRSIKNASCFSIDHATNNAPLPRHPSSAQLAGGYWGNATTQELIPILGEDHPDYLQNRERITEALRRWERGTSK